MFREIIIALLVIHGIIHLIGFAKSAKIKEIDQFNESISKPYGLLWLFVCILFMISSVSFLLGQSWWVFVAIISVILSQLLILRYWLDARTGTIINAILTIAIVIYFSIQ